ncbi:MAG: undecaprenyl/decaprenyl-phosphate alpha-N-acetylglucosaminyl 1-phosphate transferase [Desulfobacterales bacterium]|nr:undecaprenyl/decaprenyl-phosphate alpha-N-acetylglucosaminyl 1-phosphate transferase [Desulfobacterales bacterium]MCF8078446.1 undecaprenyl/decaprenyl-phosphate alpha-N-acetylglucosaminyl 1-phosphate transferase [Desulfobacterales bacterium]
MRGFFDNRMERRLYIVVPLATLLLTIPPVRSHFASIGWRWMYILTFSFALSFTLTPVFRWAARRCNVYDLPSGRKVHPEATPLLGGGAVFFGFAVAIIANGVYSGKLASIIIASLVLFTVSLIDDIHEVPAWLKLVAQLACVSIVMSQGIVLRVAPSTYGVFAEAANVFLTVLWIVGITNAMNFFDGMNGLASGLGAIIAFFLGIVAFQTDQPFIGWVAVGIMGSCLGFLPYNFQARGKATIFLGDAGSIFIGFVLACLAVYGDWAENNPVGSLISPILIFWVLIFDMIHITVDRISTGKVKSFKQWIDYVGKDHLHHRMAVVLGGPRRSVLFIFMINACLGTSAVVLRDARRPIDALLLLGQAVIFVMLITVLERRGRHNAISCAGDEPPSSTRAPDTKRETRS